MILEQIAVQNWRGYRERHEFRFRDGINLLVGRNEAGKSTLFEALTRVLFDRHNSKTEEIRAIQPIQTSLAPEAEVLFKVNGRRYRAVKRFLESPRSELYTERGGKWELEHEGDSADARLRDILGGEATMRTAARPEHRGLAQALWCLQSDAAIPQCWTGAVKEGLEGLIKLAARSPIETTVADAIARHYANYWTPGGKVATQSELNRVQLELQKLEEQRAELNRKLESVKALRERLDEIRRSETDKKEALQRARTELASLAVSVQQAEEVERERVRREQAQKEAVQKARRFQEDLTNWQSKQHTVLQLQAEVQQLTQEQNQIEIDIRVEDTIRDQHKRRWQDELEPALKAVEDELRALHAVQRLQTLQQEQRRLEQQLQKIATIERQLHELRKQRAELLAPGDEQWKRFTDASQKLGVLQAQVEASAVRVAFEWIGTPRPLQIRPRIEPKDHEYLVAEPTEFSIDGVVKVHVRSGASALKDLVAQRDTIQAEVQHFLTRFAVADADELAALYEKGRNLDAAIAVLQRQLEETQQEGPDAREQLIRVKRHIDEEMRIVNTLSPGTQWQEADSIRTQITEREQYKQRLIRDINDAQNREQAAADKHLRLVASRENTVTKLAACKAQLKLHEEAISAFLQNYGSFEQLRQLVAASEEDVRVATAAWEALLSEYEEKVTRPRQLYEQTEQQIRELELQLHRLDRDAADALARIEELTAQASYTELADLEIRLERMKQRREVLTRRAEGAKLLYQLVNAYHQARSAALSGPIQQLVNPWLRLLTDENYDALQIDHDLKPIGVRMPSYDAELPLDSLSFGAREQVVVLLRLAIAVLVSDEDRNLVVIDDRLVNADPVRMARLCLILQEVARKCQIVIATCNDTPYAGLGAHIVRVPADGAVSTT